MSFIVPLVCIGIATRFNNLFFLSTIMRELNSIENWEKINKEDEVRMKDKFKLVNGGGKRKK